jgi:hypothetical protein
MRVTFVDVPTAAMEEACIALDSFHKHIEDEPRRLRDPIGYAAKEAA